MEILTHTGPLLLLMVIAEFIVFIAMLVDLVAGINKANIRGEFRRSQILKRTVSKFLLYEGSMLIAGCIDMLITLSRVLELLNFTILVNVPLISFGVGIFLCIVEIISVREKADEKMHSELSAAEKLIKQALSREELTEIITTALINSKIGRG